MEGGMDGGRGREGCMYGGRGMDGGRGREGGREGRREGGMYVWREGEGRREGG